MSLPVSEYLLGIYGYERSER